MNIILDLLKKNEMYDLENIQANQPNLRDFNNLQAFRMLFQSGEPSPNTPNESSLVESKNTTVVNNNGTKSYDANQPNNQGKLNDHAPNIGYLINGNGVAGIAVVFIFLFPVLIGSYALMSIFVNTKSLDQPIRIKIMD
jgi:hypothetical protein